MNIVISNEFFSLSDSIRILEYITLLFIFLALLVVFFLKITYLIISCRIRHLLRSNKFKVARKNGTAFILIKPLPFYWLGISIISLSYKGFSSNMSRAKEHFYQVLTNVLMRNKVSKVAVIIRRDENMIIHSYFCILVHSFTRGGVRKRILESTNMFVQFFKNLDYSISSHDNLKDLIRFLSRPMQSIAFTIKNEVHVKGSQGTALFSYILETLENAFIEETEEFTFVASLSSPRMTRPHNDSKPIQILDESTKEKTVQPTILSVRLNYAFFFPLNTGKQGTRDSFRIFNRIERFKNLADVIANAILSSEITRSGNVKGGKVVLSTLLTSLFENLFASDKNSGVKILTDEEETFNVMLQSSFSILRLLIRHDIELPQLIVKNDLAKGELFIGYQLINTKESMPFKLSIDDLKRHIIITGPSGKGKTRLARILINELRRKYRDKIRIWIFDFHGEYVDLIRENFHVIIPGSLIAPLALNVFEPFKENPETYSYFLINLFSEAMRSLDNPLTPQMERILSLSIYETINNPDQRAPHFFIYNLWQWSNRLANELPTAMQSFHAIINRIRTLFSGMTSRIFWVTKSNIDISKLLTRNLIFDLSFLTRRGTLKRDLIILINVLLRYVISEAISKGVPTSDDLKLFIVIEEGRYIVPWRKKENASETTTIEDLTILARKYGLALCTISQSPSSISTDILENSGTIFILGGEPPSKEKALFDDSVSRYLSIMPPREAIVRLTTHPSITHIRIREINLTPIPFREYKKRLYKVGLKLREMYSPIPLSFENLIADIIKEKITLENLYTLHQQAQKEDISKIDPFASNLETELRRVLEKPNMLELLINNPQAFLRRTLTNIDNLTENLGNKIIEIILNVLREKADGELSKFRLLEIEYNLKRLIAKRFSKNEKSL